MTATLARLVVESRDRLTAAGIEHAALDARHLVSGVLGLSLTDVVTRGRDLVTEADVARVRAAVERRSAREPVYRILGEREFFGLPLKLSRETLEPRPDTETLVDRMIPYLRRTVATKGSCRLVDLGTGTGAICLALLATVLEARGTATDISEDALATASANAEALGLSGRFEAVRSNWFDKVEGRFDAIVSNPPYIPSNVVAELEPEVRLHDPAAALDGGDDGLDAYRAIALQAGHHLETNGVIGLEIGFDQKEAVAALFSAENFRLREEAKDLGGNDRVLIFERSFDR
ncbi:MULTISPECIES: peptide chain release factor N(5)-glutamine methyltransferase [Ensifer]|uniref:Release factor glutamine methyltransferase n=1 Tax=Ensifer canadensis TaxID=555315 RepID=A0AAW4FVC0_9HYPH|nr:MULTISPECIES: peptide chain release factor N(5)-glutamine methyltransferase [Ensifer]KQU81772.1 protein-(glutamine-N5) methyltransferase, release factor-specific [Ensifer sp. Root31]KQW66077.1 protein-(glutamine-N5) methyltransferase, release factor-specific [Ensifer sp. Root127]KQY66293.1 protein-(glutamine-N5) methyltransferase, release factor-specific [Ensifer sp. Root142]MBD9492023.1 peptide chain release factor N(5)-glutamine methyltransferase [Ensifer sp. ENS11]MBM3095240.1 peptide ch